VPIIAAEDVQPQQTLAIERIDTGKKQNIIWPNETVTSEDFYEGVLALASELLTPEYKI
jgi:hypothetical protein